MDVFLLFDVLVFYDVLMLRCFFYISEFFWCKEIILSIYGFLGGGGVFGVYGLF